MTKIKAHVRVYKWNENKELEKILNRVLSPYLHTCVRAHVHVRTHMRTRTCAHIYLCMTRGGLICHHIAPLFNRSMSYATSAHDKVIKLNEFNSK